MSNTLSDCELRAKRMTHALFRCRPLCVRVPLRTCVLVAKLLMQIQTAPARSESAKRMAWIFALLFVWFLVGDAHSVHESRFFPANRYAQQRLTRGIERLKYHNLDLGTARGYGKRSVDVNHVNNMLLNWLETRMRNLDLAKNPTSYQDFMPE